MTLTDILGKIGGTEGQQGGIVAISKLFGDHGLQGIVSQLQSHGMDKQVKSWIGNGQNMPVSGADVRSMVDPSMLTKMARQQDMSPDELCDHVAQALPNLVDKATPNGQVPKQGGVDALLGMVKKK